MSNSRSIQVQIVQVLREISSIGSKITVFRVHVFDLSLSYFVELDDMEISFLHEELSRLFPNSPRLQKPRWTLFESDQSIHERRCLYEKYLNEVLSCAFSVTSSLLWATLAVPAPAAISHRFLVRGDNFLQLEELSGMSDQILRLASPVMITAISRMLCERSDDISTVTSASTILGRIFSASSNPKLLSDCGVVPHCLRALFQSSSSEMSIHVISQVACSLVSLHPQSLFWYFQRDGGLMELIELVGAAESTYIPRAVQGLAEVIWIGVSQCRDVELAIADKSSVGISLLNKLLMRGPGTETELVVTTTLAFLFVRGQVPDYADKICGIIPTVMSLDSFCVCSSLFPKFLHLLGKPETPVLPEFEQVIALACFLVVAKCLRDPTFFDRVQLRSHIGKRLRQIIFTGSAISEATRAKCAEALVVLGGPDLGSLENLTQALEMEKYVYLLNSGIIEKKIQKLNNFFIEANFDLSSRNLVDPIGTDHSRVLSNYTDQIDDLVKAIDADQMQLQLIHTKALNEVVSGMFQVKSLMKELEAVGSQGDLTSNPAIAEIESKARELKELESTLSEKHNDQQQEPLKEKARELKVAIMESASARELTAQRTSILKSYRSVNLQVMQLNNDTFASLVTAVKQIDAKSESAAQLVHQLKTVLVKVKNQIDDLLDQVESDAAGSSPVSP